MWDNDPKNDLWGSDEEENDPEGEFRLSPRVVFLATFIIALVVFLLIQRC